MPTKRPKLPTDETLKAKALSRWEGEGGAPAGGHPYWRPGQARKQAEPATDHPAAHDAPGRKGGKGKTSDTGKTGGKTGRGGH
jgi:hypothetical protein